MSDQQEFTGAPEPPDGELDPSSIEHMSFELALNQLEAIVQKLERGQLDLDQSIKAYEIGTRLRQHCDAKLRDARLRVEKLTLAKDSTVSLEAMESLSAPDP